MSNTIDIHGHVASGFGPVEDAFRQNFRKRGEIGAALAISVAGERVVDLWAGLADTKQRRPWDEDTLAMVFSSSKGPMATAFLMLADRGLLDYARPVADYWPEFAANGKSTITVGQLFDHRAGLAAIKDKMRLEDFADPEHVATILARQPPVSPPDQFQAYGATSLGAYAGVLFRKITGTSLGEFIDREIARPLQADFYLGLPESCDGRVAELVSMTKREWLLTMLPQMLNGKNEDGRLARGIANPLSLTHRALLNPDMGGDPVGQLSSKNYWRLELPWANGIASARGLERIYAVLACGGELDGKRLLSQQTLAAVYPCRSWDYDQVLRKELGFSYGFLKEGRGVFSPNAETFGHAGLGGSMGMADPVTSMAFAYVMNRMDHRLRSPRCLALCEAVYQCL